MLISCIHYIRWKLPTFQPVATLPLHSIVGILIFIPELHCDFVVLEREELLTQLVAVLLAPLPGQEFLDRFGSGKELVAVTPDAVYNMISESFRRSVWVDLPSVYAFETASGSLLMNF